MTARKALLIVVFGALLLTGAGMAWSLATTTVEVRVDGRTLHARAFGGDVAGVLDRLEVEIGPADRVEPAPRTPIADGMVVHVVRAKTVELDIDGQDPRTVTAAADTVGEMLRAAGLAGLLDSGARIDPPPSAPVRDGDRIHVTPTVAVTIVADGREQRLLTLAGTVAEALADAGVVLGDHDRVDPGLRAALAPASVITVLRADIAEAVSDVVIGRGEQRRETADLPAGHTRVETEGEDGLRRETYRVVVVDGVEVARELVAEQTVREPVDRVVLVGVGGGLILEAQRLLADLGYPAGAVDGQDGPQTRRALCAWRRLEGRDAGRGALLPGELDALRATTGLPAAAAGRGVTVDKTCQTLYYWQDGRWRDVQAVSTGAGGLPLAGDYAIQRVRPGWHTSTLYPAPEPNMYNTLYFHGAIAIHGSNVVPPYPASSGCVRVTPTAADRLFADLAVGDPVRVIGSY